MNVEFRTSPWQRAFDALFALAVCVLAALLGSVLMFLLLGPLMPRTWPVRTMIGLSAGAAVMLAIAGLLLTRRRPVRIVLDERSLRASSLLYRRVIPYEDVTLLSLRRPDNTLGGGCQVIARRTRGRPISIWLRRHDAEECFDTLRRMCEHAPAIDLEAAVLTPEDPLHRRHGLLVAADEFRRRARRNVLVAALTAVFSVSAILGLVSHYSGTSTSSRSVSRRWFSAVFFPIAAIGAGMAWRSNRRFAGELEDGAKCDRIMVSSDDDDTEA